MNTYKIRTTGLYQYAYSLDTFGGYYVQYNNNTVTNEYIPISSNDIFVASTPEPPVNTTTDFIKQWFESNLNDLSKENAVDVINHVEKVIKQYRKSLVRNIP